MGRRVRSSRFLALLVLLIPLVSFAAVTVTVNGTNHTIPQTNEKGWGNNVTAWIQAISQNTLQPSGGNFTLSAETDFGPNFGLKSTYFKSRGLNLAGAGVLRLANGEAVGWRNAGNTGNLLLSVNASDQLMFNGNPVIGNSPLTVNRAVYTDGSGVLSTSSTTSAELGYLSGVTSAVQTQLNDKQPAGDYITALTGDVTASGPGLASATIAAGAIDNSKVAVSAGITDTKLATISTSGKVANSATTATSANTASAIVARDGSGNFSAGTITANVNGNVTGTAANVTGIVAIANGGTGQTTRQAAFDAISPNTTKGDISVRTSSTNTRVPVGADGQVLSADSTQSTGVKWITPASASVVAPDYSGVTRINTATTVTADTTLNETHENVYVNSIAGSVTITLPDAAAFKGKRYYVKKTDNSAIPVNIASTNTINGTSASGFVLRRQTDEFEFRSDGTGWFTTALGPTSFSLLPSRIEAAQTFSVCSTGTCTISRQTGGLTSITRSAAGSYIANFPSGVFSDVPICTCSATDSGGNGRMCNIRADTASATSVPFTVTNSTASFTDSLFTIQCVGRR